MVSQAQIRATNQYAKTHTRRFIIQCNNKTEKDIIDYLVSSPNINAEVKRLIRKELKQRTQDNTY